MTISHDSRFAVRLSSRRLVTLAVGLMPGSPLRGRPEMMQKAHEVMRGMFDAMSGKPDPGKLDGLLDCSIPACFEKGDSADENEAAWHPAH